MNRFCSFDDMYEGSVAIGHLTFSPHYIDLRPLRPCHCSPTTPLEPPPNQQQYQHLPDTAATLHPSPPQA